MHKVQQIDRDAACELLTKNAPTSTLPGIVAVGEYDSHDAVQAFAAYRLALAECILTDPNIATALQSRMCCNGVHCGCQGATVEQYLRYQLIERE